MKCQKCQTEILDIHVPGSSLIFQAGAALRPSLPDLHITVCRLCSDELRKLVRSHPDGYYDIVEDILTPHHTGPEAEDPQV